MIWISDDHQLIENETFSGNCSAFDLHEDGKKRGTFRTASVLVDGNNITFRNCIFENTAGSGKTAGQAIALYLDGDDILLENCWIKGHQDTLFLAPLPQKEILPGGFLGPKQFAPRTDRMVIFRKCRIEGGVDFIFGGASALFEECEFHSVEAGYVFAPSTPKHRKTGFTAVRCKFTCAKDVEDRSCFLARPWRNNAKVHLENCWMDRHIHPLGWDDWNKKEAHETVEFVEVDSCGPGSNDCSRPKYVKVIRTK